MIATVISSIVAIGFSSVLMFTRNMYNDTMVRSQLSQDAFVVDQYVRTKLTSQVSDSLQIFASASDESSEITSTSGIILRSVRMDGTVDHLSLPAHGFREIATQPFFHQPFLINTTSSLSIVNVAGAPINDQ